ncbi:hypothetical protein ACSBR2_008130 [Camellia fascicularis]
MSKIFLKIFLFAAYVCVMSIDNDLLELEYGDIKPDNLLVTAAGTVTIGDFSVSQVFKDIPLY